MTLVLVLFAGLGIGLIAFGLRPGPWLFDITDADINGPPRPRSRPLLVRMLDRLERLLGQNVDRLAATARDRAEAARPAPARRLPVEDPV